MVRPVLCSNLFQKPAVADADFLEALFLIMEIKQAVWACGSEKAPGPDGFTHKFFKIFWETIKNDIYNYVK